MFKPQIRLNFVYSRRFRRNFNQSLTGWEYNALKTVYEQYKIYYKNKDIDPFYVNYN